MSVRVGVIGIGYLGQHHVRIYSELEDTELVAVVDTVEKRADAFAVKYGCEAYYDHRDIFNKVDALSIVTPTITHYSIALDCIRAGKDILIEKPITVSVNEADELIAESEKKGCIVQIGHLERYNPAVLVALEMVKEPKFIEAERLSPFLGRGTDIDVTLDLMIHDVDIVLTLVSSQVKEIRAVGTRVLTDKIDVAKAWIEVEDGCTALFTASRLSPEKQRRLRVFQRDSYLLLDYQNCEIRHYFRRGEEILSDTIKPDNKESLKEELRDFIICVKERKRPKVSAVEGRNALKIALDITKQIKTG